MATTSGKLTADTAVTGRHGLGAKLAAGAAALGCAAALAFGGLQLRDVAPAPAATSSRLGDAGRQQFLERNLQLPGGTLAAAATTFEAQRFLEGNVDLPAGVLPVPAATVEAWRFLEQNVWLPGGGAPFVVPAGPGPVEYLPGEEPAAAGGKAPAPVSGPQP